MANNMTPQSLLAIENLYVLNSGINAPECQPPKPQLFETILWWVIIAVCLGILFLFILTVGIYCIVKNCENRNDNK